MDRLAAMNAFVNVSQNRSFVAAGRAIGISASAVGKSVARLEQQLGVRLLHRSTRSVTLTPEGEVFLRRAKRVLEELEQASLEINRSSGLAHGLMRVSVPMVGDLLTPIVASFCRRNLDVVIDLEVTNRTVDLIEEGFDLVIRTGTVADTNLVTRRLASFRMITVASSDYIARYGEPREPSDLVGHRCIRMRLPQTGRMQPWVFDTETMVRGDIAPAAICNDLTSIIRMAEEAQGIAYVPEFAVRETGGERRLVEVLAERTTETVAFQAIRPPGRIVTPKVKAFIDFVAVSLKSKLAVGTVDRRRDPPSREER